MLGCPSPALAKTEVCWHQLCKSGRGLAMTPSPSVASHEQQYPPQFSQLCAGWGCWLIHKKHPCRKAWYAHRATRYTLAGVKEILEEGTFG